jgi:hypothetical protein
VSSADTSATNTDVLAAGGKIKAAMLDEDAAGIVGSTESLLQQNGFKPWGSKEYIHGDSGYAAKYLYILRRTPVPSHLVMVVSEPQKGGNGPSVDIFFDDVIEMKNHSVNANAYESSNPIRQIEKVLGMDFEMHTEPGGANTYVLFTGIVPKKTISMDQLKKVIDLFKAIKV